MDAQPLVSIIILNYNGKDVLKDCIESVLKTDYPNLEVIIVDNASIDKSYEIVERYNNVKLIKNKQNYGFAKGNNIGIKASKGEFVVLLNNDTIVHHAWIKELVNVALQDPKIGILGCKLYYHSSNIIQHAGGVLNLYGKGLSHIGQFGEDRGQFNDTASVDFVTGAAMMIKRDVINKIGLLDEEYFMYYEDVDYCYRAKKAGFKVVYVPQAIVYHYEGFTSNNRLPNKKIILTERNRMLFLLKNFNKKELFTFILYDIMSLPFIVCEGVRRILFKKTSKIKLTNNNILYQKLVFDKKSILIYGFARLYSYIFLLKYLLLHKR